MTAAPLTTAPLPAATLLGTTVRLAPFRLDRISGIRADVLAANASVSAALAAHAAAREALDIAAGPLLDSMFGLVPHCEQGERRRLLALKRRVHKGTRLSVEDAEFLTTTGVPSIELHRWFAAHELHADAGSRLTAAVQDCVAETAIRLRTHMTTGGIAQAVALVAPDFAASAASADYRPGSRAARTALLYLARAAVKPSPLSHLTAVSLHPSAVVGTCARVAVPVGLVHRLFTELASTPRFIDAFTYTPVHRSTGDDGTTRIVLRTASANDAFLWHDERVLDPGAYAAELDELGGGPTALPPERASRYVSSGLLTPIAPWPAGSTEPLRELADTVRASAAADASVVAGALEDLQDAAQALAVAVAETEERIAASAALRASCDAAIELCGAPAWPATVAHEDVVVADRIGPLPAPVEEDLRSLADELRPYLFRSFLYDVVVDAFRSRYGSGGRCADVTSFFLRIQADPDVARLLRTARARDLEFDVETASEPRTTLPVGRTSAPPNAAVMFQVAAARQGMVTADDHLVVVNQFGSALGGLFTRYAPLVGSDVAGCLQPWLDSLFPDCEVRSFTLSAQVNNLQHAGAGVLPEVVWATDRQRRRSPAISLADLCLVHEADSDTLEFRTPTGEPVAPVYTGIVPATLCPGAARLALAVMDPWVDGSPLTRENHPLLRAQSLNASAEVTSRPRRRTGRVVTGRARWTVRGTSFPRPAAGESDPDYLLRLDEWRRRHGIPEEVFFLALGADPLDANRRKPVWLDFASPHSVRTAVPFIEGAQAVRIDEALPGRGQAWAPGPDGLRMCEHVSFLAWERPGRGAR